MATVKVDTWQERARRDRANRLRDERISMIAKSKAGLRSAEAEEATARAGAARGTDLRARLSAATTRRGQDVGLQTARETGQSALERQRLAGEQETGRTEMLEAGRGKRLGQEFGLRERLAGTESRLRGQEARQAAEERRTAENRALAARLTEQGLRGPQLSALYETEGAFPARIGELPGQPARPERPVYKTITDEETGAERIVAIDPATSQFTPVTEMQPRLEVADRGEVPPATTAARMARTAEAQPEAPSDAIARILRERGQPGRPAAEPAAERRVRPTTEEYRERAATRAEQRKREKAERAAARKEFERRSQILRERRARERVE